MFREKSGSHERLLQRYNSFIKIEKKKVRRESTKKVLREEGRGRNGEREGGRR